MTVGNRLLYTVEAAELVGVSLRTIQRWHASGVLKPFDHDRSRPLYLDLDVYLAERVTRTRPRVAHAVCVVPQKKVIG